MAAKPKSLDVVALAVDLPELRLDRGFVGTIVDELGLEVFEVEFSDEDGRPYATAALRADQLILLHFEPPETQPT